jgi:uncharacterized iron-regulated protein
MHILAGRSAAALVVGVFLLNGASAQDTDKTEKKSDLDATLRQLEKDIGAVRGLAFKSPVAAKVIPRGKDAAVGAQGYYSTKDKTLYVYDDVAGNYQRGVLIHEMVHALQDQHFGLTKLHRADLDSDAELALAALVEGDATYTMIELLKKEQPKAAAMLDVPLDKAKDLRKAFLYAQGARYVKALKERGGWEAVNNRYRFAPRTTAAILHPEGVSTIDLGPGRSVGEFGLMQMLLSQPATHEQAVAAVAGWIGDRIVEGGAVKSWVIAFAGKKEAERFNAALALARAHRESRPKALANLPEGENVWLEPDGRMAGVLLRGARVFWIEAPGEAAYRAAVERLEGPPTLEIYCRKERQSITFGEFVDRLLDVELVCVGEQHDSELCHRVQLQIIRSLYARDPRLGVGMEMFQRPYQSHLDRFSKGEIDEYEMLKATEYPKRWGYAWCLYEPIVDFCKRNSVPLAALNASRELTGKLSKVGYTALTAEERQQLGTVDFQVKAHRDHWYEQLAKMHGKSKVTEEQKERSYQVMTTWDEYMAASAAAFQQTRHLRRMVILAGSGHIDHGFGIPARAVQRTGGRAATVHLAPGGDPGKLFANPVADYVIVIR